MDLSNFTISQIHNGLKNKDFSATQLVGAYFENIEKKDKDIFAYLSLTKEMAMFQAKEVDSLIANKQELPLLAGVPFAVKDNIMVKDIKCTAGSKILENYFASFDAGVIEKLKANKSVILGKTNLDEFGMGSSTENSAFGNTKNPRDLSRVPGGSSGGSVASVIANECVFALGSDTGGSIRLPCSFCGAVGLKPTYGSVSRYGLIAFASSLEQIGVITKTVEDAEIVFNAIKGRDANDSTSVDLSSIKQTKHKSEKLDIKKTRIGIPKEYFVKGIDPAVEKSVKNAIKKYQELGAKIVEISLPNTEYALAVYYIISMAEASSNLARYDGIRYGKSLENDEQNANNDLLSAYMETRGKNFGKEVRRRIMIGTFVLSAGYYDAYYLKAQKVRNKIIQDFNSAFEKVDVILAPVSPFMAFKIGEKIGDPLSMYLSDIFTVSVNLAGLPALSLPCKEKDSLPTGFQLIGPAFEEDKILEIGKLI
ncbi:MAG: Asp-tRNA(Asn)/Glu-tRNA(Gln) amidotransferase subunit GatA [Patescibacteria group bacterium]|nr:Asp-tRNA(Asn)/Glu-tRNA(Gln) amidotransferase subunit GatA [Patescibacteria group bacterium]